MGRRATAEEPQELTDEQLASMGISTHEEAEEALQDGSRERLHTALSTISDWWNPDSIVEIDTENDTVEVVGWVEQEDEEA